MDFRTPVAIPPCPFRIEPGERMLCVGSCFADEMGRRFTDWQFRVTTNPHGVMYNPASILHTVESLHLPTSTPKEEQGVAILTLGTNHVYRLKATGEIVDNCQKRPARLFEEEELSVAACAAYLRRAVQLLRRAHPHIRIVLTVSPIRYRKYGFHGSQLSKATLLLAADQVAREAAAEACPSYLYYFPAYEIVNDELRDYRFYRDDMLHPTQQAVDYIYERFAEACFSERTHRFIEAYRPIRAALAHRPFDAESPQYKAFLSETRRKAEQLGSQWGIPISIL